MKKKNIAFILSSITLCLLILMSIVNLQNTDKNILENSKESNKIVKNNTLTMMYETDYQSGEYQVSTDTTWPQEGYTFNEVLSKCENGGILTWDDNNKKVLLQTNTSDKCYVYFDKNPLTLASYIINNIYTGTDGDNGLYYHDGSGSYTNADQEAGDNSYRYAGANPNNYVCFGSDEAVCSEDNLYRIIGVFDENGEYQTKLIKNTSIGKYKWDADEINFDEINISYEENVYNLIQLAAFFPDPSEGGANIWEESDLNNYINNDSYLDILEEKWQNKIANTTWQIGGNTYQNIQDVSAKKAYTNEIISPVTSIIYNAKIGLIYVSDYGYAASPDSWTTILADYNNVADSNWLYSDYWEWTITRCSRGSDNETFVFMLISSGGVDSIFSVSSEQDVRPTFYLNSNVQYISGSGTQTDPYRIA